MTSACGSEAGTRPSLPQTKRLLGLALFLAAVGACTESPPSPPPPAPTSIVDATGILLIDVEEQVQAGPLPRPLAEPFSDALMLAEANGEDLGYPWVDPETLELVLSAVTPRGRDLIEAAGIAVPYRIRDVEFGAGELRRIEDDASLLGSRDVPGAELISITLPDHRDNRALIVISELSRPLLEYLAETYPVDAIAVQVDPNEPVDGS